MKRIVLVLVSLFVFASPAYAEEPSDYPWRGAEIQLKFEGSLEAIPDVLSLNSNLTLYWVPEGDVMQAFVYVGVKWNILPWFWVCPMVGFAANGPSGDAFDLSLWTGGSLFNGTVTSNSESDLLVNEYGEVDYYGYQSIDIHLGIINFGVQGEQFNEGYMFGPHIGIFRPLGDLIVASTELQYYFGFQDVNRGHNIRLFLGFSL